jgi:hypothetical protein
VRDEVVGRSILTWLSDTFKLRTCTHAAVTTPCRGSEERQIRGRRVLVAWYELRANVGGTLDDTQVALRLARRTERD